MANVHSTRAWVGTAPSSSLEALEEPLGLCPAKALQQSLKLWALPQRGKVGVIPHLIKLSVACLVGGGVVDH